MKRRRKYKQAVTPEDISKRVTACTDVLYDVVCDTSLTCGQSLLILKRVQKALVNMIKEEMRTVGAQTK